jgi:futalosine hydrolase
MEILFVTSYQKEYDAVLKGISPYTNVHVTIGGVGPIQSAIQTVKALTQKEYDLVICMGIGGGFSHKTRMGDLVIADRIICGDLGAETERGFLPLDQMGFGSTQIECDFNTTDLLCKALQQSYFSVHLGPIITVSTATGTEESTAKLVTRMPHALCEAMEGFGVASAARSYNIPFVEIRAISNVVGLRDKSSWRIDEALSSLTKAAKMIGAELKNENCILPLSK